MAGFRTCMSLTGGSIGTEAVEIKSYDELNQIGKSTNNGFLLYKNFLNRMSKSHLKNMIQLLYLIQLFKELP